MPPLRPDGRTARTKRKKRKRYNSAIAKNRRDQELGSRQAQEHLERLVLGDELYDAIATSVGAVKQRAMDLSSPLDTSQVRDLRMVRPATEAGPTHQPIGQRGKGMPKRERERKEEQNEGDWDEIRDAVKRSARKVARTARQHEAVGTAGDRFRQFGPTHSGRWTPERAAEERRKREERPGAELRTPEAEQWKKEYDENSPRYSLPELFLRSGAAVGTAADFIFTGGTGQQVAKFLKDPSVEEGLWTAAAVVPGTGLFGRAARPIIKGARTAGRAAAYGSYVGRLPQSASAITSGFQRHVIDPWVLERGGKLVDEWRLSDSAIKQAVGKVITPATARGRVVKEAGRVVSREARRRRAQVAPELRLLDRTARYRPDKSMAHFWYATMPAHMRNPEGLRALAKGWKRELEDITSGARLRRLRQAVEEFTESGDELARDLAVTEIQDLALLEQDLKKAIRNAETLAKKNIAVDDRLIDASEALMDWREQILIESGELTAETAAARRNLTWWWSQLDEGEVLGDAGVAFRADSDVAALQAKLADARARLKGLEDTFDPVNRATLREGIEATEKEIDSLKQQIAALGDEGGRRLEDAPGAIYAGHRMGKVPRQRGDLVPGGRPTGKTRPPQGVHQMNRGTLLSTGRVRPDLRVFIEDWQAAQVFEMTNLMKRDLIQMGEPVVGRVKSGYVLVNPMGRKIKREWRVNVADDLEDAGFDAVAATDMDEGMNEILSTFIRADGEYGKFSGAEVMDAIIKQANKEGWYSDLRQVPLDVFERYYGQIVPPKLIQRAATKSGLRTAGSALNAANDLLYASLIYTSPGYIPSNLAGNLIFGALHQGAFIPQTLAKTGSFFAKADPRTRAQVLSEIGHGVTTSVASEGTWLPSRAVRGLAGGMGHITDSGPRVAAFMHEAAKGIVPKEVRISRGFGWTADDARKLNRLLNDPEYRGVLDDIHARSVEAMVNFDRLGPWEKSVAKKVLFVWPWIRGATAYPFRFAYDHPLRSAAMGYVAAGGNTGPLPFDDWRDAIMDNRMEETPGYLRGAIEVGETIVEGEAFPRIVNPNPFSPVSTAQNAIGSLLGRPGYETIGEFLSPGLQAGYNTLFKRTPFGSEAESYREAAGMALERLTPQVGLARDLISPPSLEEAGMYPEDVTREGRLRRASRVLPYAVDPEEVAAAAKRESGKKKGKIQIRMDEVQKSVDELKARLEATGIDLPPEYQDALDKVISNKRAIAYVEGQLMHQLDIDKLSPKQKLYLRIGVIENRMGRELADAVREQYARYGVTDAMTEKIIAQADELLGFDWYSELMGKLKGLRDRAEYEAAVGG